MDPFENLDYRRGWNDATWSSRFWVGSWCLISFLLGALGMATIFQWLQ